MSRTEPTWHLFTDDYQKQFYSVKLSDGTIIKNCWPNAGKMHVHGITYTPEDKIMVRMQPDYEEPNE